MPCTVDQAAPDNDKQNTSSKNISSVDLMQKICLTNGYSPFFKISKNEKCQFSKFPKCLIT